MSVPLSRLPSLDWVRGFVAVARRMSITKAADDLCLTQSALSKQVRALEDALGVKLLVRGYRRLELTAEGRRLFQHADAVMWQLQDALGGFAIDGWRPVTITASVGVTGLWLLPRLGEFQRRHPDVEVRVTSSNALLNLAAEQVDVAIRYCTQTQAPPNAIRLFGETIAPVASPALGLRSLPDAHALESQVLLEYDDDRPWLQWDNWLAARSWRPRAAHRVLRFNQYDQVILAATTGQGIALGRLELLAPMLADGRLVELACPDAESASAYAYWLVLADPKPRHDVAKLADWVLEEAARLQTG